MYDVWLDTNCMISRMWDREIFIDSTCLKSTKFASIGMRATSFWDPWKRSKHNLKRLEFFLVNGKNMKNFKRWQRNHYNYLTHTLANHLCNKWNSKIGVYSIKHDWSLCQSWPTESMQHAKFCNESTSRLPFVRKAINTFRRHWPVTRLQTDKCSNVIFHLKEFFHSVW